MCVRVECLGQSPGVTEVDIQDEMINQCDRVIVFLHCCMTNERLPPLLLLLL